MRLSKLMIDECGVGIHKTGFLAGVFNTTVFGVLLFSFINSTNFVHV
jgi:hypothetical protein